MVTITLSPCWCAKRVIFTLALLKAKNDTTSPHKLALQDQVKKATQLAITRALTQSVADPLTPATLLKNEQPINCNHVHHFTLAFREPDFYVYLYPIFNWTQTIYNMVDWTGFSQAYQSLPKYCQFQTANLLYN